MKESMRRIINVFISWNIFSFHLADGFGISMLPKIRTFMVALFLLIVCCKESSDKIYIISKEDSISRTKYIRKDRIVLMPPAILHGEHTFLIDSNYNFYYYSSKKEVSKGIAGNDILDESDSLGLNPNHIFKIPIDLEKDFFDANIFSKEKKMIFQNIIVASSRDTIVSDFIPFLREIKNDSLSNIKITFRRVLDEEKVALRYKIKSLIPK